jgi:hypothetical protein
MDVPWQRFGFLMSEHRVPGRGRPDLRHRGQPAGVQLHRHQYPDEREQIDQLLALSDEELVTDVLADFQRIIPVPAGERVEDYVLDTKVTRYPLGEIELSPEYFTEQLPHLATPTPSAPTRSRRSHQAGSPSARSNRLHATHHPLVEWIVGRRCGVGATHRSSQVRCGGVPPTRTESQRRPRPCRRTWASALEPSTVDADPGDS